MNLKKIILILVMTGSLYVPGMAQKTAPPKYLDSVVKQGALTHSDAIIIYQNGKLIVNNYFNKKPQKIECMSVTKSIVSLAVGKMITDGLLNSIDTPVSHYYPEWKQGKKRNITIRQILSHTSGLQNVRITTVEIYPSPDFVKLALAAELDNEPGVKFSYNNKAINLIAGLIQKITGQRMDQYIGEHLFKPLGISDYTWSLDSAGNPHAMSGCQILPADLLKLGILTLNKGAFNGKQLISRAWIDESLQPLQNNPYYGLQWWLASDGITYSIDDEQIANMYAKQVDTAFITKAKLMKGTYPNFDAYAQAAYGAFGKDWDNIIYNNIGKAGIPFSKKRIHKLLGFSAEGDLGNSLFIVPEKNLVAVRMISSDSYKSDQDNFQNFERYILKL